MQKERRQEPEFSGRGMQRMQGTKEFVGRVKKMRKLHRLLHVMKLYLRTQM